MFPKPNTFLSCAFLFCFLPYLVAQPSNIAKKNTYAFAATYNYDVAFNRGKVSFWLDNGSGLTFLDTTYSFFRPHHSVAIAGTLHHRLSKYFRADLQLGLRTWGFEGWHYAKTLPSLGNQTQTLYEIEFTKQTYVFASLGTGVSFENSQMRIGAQCHLQQYLGGQAQVSTEQLSLTDALLERDHHYLSQTTRPADTRGFRYTQLSQYYYLDHRLSKRLFLTLAHERSLGTVFKSTAQRYLPMPLRVWSVGLKIN